MTFFFILFICGFITLHLNMNLKSCFSSNWSSDWKPPFTFVLQWIFDNKIFLQTFFSITSCGKGRKRVDSLLINYFQLLFLIKCMVSLVCEGGCATTTLFYQCKDCSWTQHWLLHPHIHRKHDDEQYNKEKFREKKYWETLFSCCKIETQCGCLE